MASLKFKEVLCLVYSGLLFLSGILLIAVSVVLTFKLTYHFKFTPSSTLGPYIVIFLLGFVHLLLTWLAVKGPTREHDFHILLFMGLTACLVLIELSIGVWSLILWSEVETESLQLMSSSFQRFINDGEHQRDWKRLQTKLECCGITSEKDYLKNETFQRLRSTCPLNFEGGCKQPLQRYVKLLMVDAAIIGFICGIFQVVGIVLFYNFYQKLKEERVGRATQRESLRQGSGNTIQTQRITPTAAAHTTAVTATTTP